MARIPIAERLERERQHARVIVEQGESNWGWHTPAGRIRRRRRADLLTSPEGLPAGPRVLEIGCGSGTFSGDLGAAFADLTCIDISETLLDVARGRHPQLRFEARDIHATGLPSASFDLIVGCSVLHHLDWDAALFELRRLLRPAGQLRFSEPNLLNPQVFLQKNWPWLKRRLGDSPDEYAFTAGQIERSLRRAGLTRCEVVPYEFLHPSVPSALIAPVIAVERVLERTPLRLFGGSLRIRAWA